jgi:hypothetical protein
MTRENRVIFDPRRQFATTDDIIPDSINLYPMLEARSEIIVQPHELENTFEQTCAAIFDFSEEYDEENIAFLVDECRFLNLPNVNYPNLEKLLRFGNPKKLDVIFTCHRPTDLSVDVRAIVDYFCIFQTSQEHDLETISARCGVDCADACKNLSAYQYVLYDDTRGIFTIKNSQYVPIERKAMVHVNG